MSVLILILFITTSMAQSATSGSLSSNDQQRIMALRVRRQSAESELQANKAAQNKPGTSKQQRAALSKRARKLQDEIERSVKEEKKIIAK
ncbi:MULTISPECIES: hypothetical protein [Ralstonia solanacearum species complex]|uniref:hypothetical protein n=1 Tax=Ralstonia solanacearum species complex TaxID=3116862 RepID=UPI001071B574|nr:hypothetical protein [Ralstonia solanacearum]